MSTRRPDEVRDGVELTNLDKPLFEGAGVTKRDLVDYLDAVCERILPGLAGRPLSVVRVRPGQPPFMQKNLPGYAPDWIPRVAIWSEASHREVHYPVCEDRRTLLWLANQRAVEYHPTLVGVAGPDGEYHPSHLIIDLDPPEGGDFAAVIATARLVGTTLAEAGLAGAVKTSGAKGVHVFVPLTADAAIDDVAAATRALAARSARLDPAVATVEYVRADRGGKVFVDSTRAGGATVVAAYSPRVRPGAPVSFPLAWDALDDVVPADLTVLTALDRLGAADPWRDLMPNPQVLPTDLIAEGHAIPIARVAAMHAGKRRKRAQRADSG